MRRIYSNLWLAIFACGLLVLSACSEDADPPVVEVHFEADATNPYTIQFSTIDENVSIYSWDFGDGSAVSTEMAPVHTYDMSGDYNVTLTVKGDGGEASDAITVSIAASLAEMLSGGPESANGKTWKMSAVATTSVDGAGQVKAHYPLDVMPFTDNILNQIGLEEEYDNEYTFKFDGSYAMDYKNGRILTGWLFALGVVGGDNVVKMTEYGLFHMSHSAPSNCAWELHEGDLVVEAANQDPGTGVITEEAITFSDVQYLTFTKGGFLGINDFNTTAIIREISSTRLVVSVFNNTDDQHPDKPSTLITVSFDAK